MNNISLGSWITLNHPSIAEILSDSGFDWLCIDIEHSVIDYNDVQKLIIAIQSKNIEAYVRVGKNDPLIIKRVLDAGADGVIVPMINSKQDIDNLVQAVLYPPNGKRGVGLARAQNYGFGFEKYKNNKAKKIKIIPQIEHIESINNLDDILSNEYIYASIIGPYDLSASLGKAGEFTDKEVKKALDKYESIAKKYQKKIGYHVIKPDHNLVIEKINKGYNLIAFSLDTIFLGEISRKEINMLKTKLK